MHEVITDNLGLWTSALLTRSTAGRVGNGSIEAPGIEKLRGLILELAVRGRLVAQDPDEEPASALLERTIIEKNRLIKQGLIRETKPPTYPAEPPDHSLPTGWVWSNLYEIGEIGPRNEANDAEAASFVPMQSISERYGIPVNHEVKPWGEIKSGFTHFAEGDVVLAKITPCFQNGKSAVMRRLTNGFGAGTTELHVYRPIAACTIPEYVLVYLKSPGFIRAGIPKMTGTAGQKRITRDYFAGNHFPLPPLAEQRRIVAKVDELMALCDKLEQQQTNSLEAHQALVETLLDTLTRTNSPQELTKAWARLANYFDILFTTEQSINQLEQAIIKLAIMGKLSPQLSNDEPATSLLLDIANKREKALTDSYPNESESKTQRRKQNEQELPKGLPRLPIGWAWATLMQCSLMVIDCHNKTAPYEESGVALLRTSNVRNGELIYDDIKYVSEKTFKRWAARATPLSGDILITREAPMGEVCILPNDQQYCMGQRIMLIRLVPNTIDPRFMLLSLRDPDLLERVQDKPVGMTVQHLRVGGVETLLVPVPPQAEQKRIVNKFNELVALCDKLRSRLSAAHAIQIQVADAIVDQVAA